MEACGLLGRFLPLYCRDHILNISQAPENDSRRLAAWGLELRVRLEERRTDPAVHFENLFGQVAEILAHRLIQLAEGLTRPVPTKSVCVAFQEPAFHAAECSDRSVLLAPSLDPDPETLLGRSLDPLGRLFAAFHQLKKESLFHFTLAFWAGHGRIVSAVVHRDIRPPIGP